MLDYIPKSKKSAPVKRLINEALDILSSVGIPFAGKGERGLEKMAMAFLAVAGVTKSWKEAKSHSSRKLTTREIITVINENYEEKISPGSYDDIRRKDLKLPFLADLILNSADNPHAAPNSPKRANTLSNDFRSLISFYNTTDWDIKLKLFNKNKSSLEEILKRKRDLPKVRMKLPTGQMLDFSQGGHNQLQREILEEFLPRFGGNAWEVLYIGDATNKYKLREDEKLHDLGFFELSHDSLPDIVAYDSENNWLYLIEAFFTSGPMSEERILELKKALKSCKAELIFVTAFTSKTDFKKIASEIGWESEVWTADNPDHLIHFNGGKFLGPHK